MKRIRQILHATDFSPASRRAFDSALSMAKSLNARVTFVHVLPPIVMIPDQYLDAVTLDRLDRQAREWSMKQLDRLVARAKTANDRGAPGSRTLHSVSIFGMPLQV